MKGKSRSLGSCVALVSSLATLIQGHALSHNVTIKERAINDFNFATGNGNCGNYMTKLERWVADVSVLADSAIKALDANVDVPDPYLIDITITLNNFLGITHADESDVSTARSTYGHIHLCL